MSTQVNPSTETAPKSKAETEAEALLADANVQTDTAFMKAMAQVDQHQLKVGGKWSIVIKHVKSKYPYTVSDDGKEELIHKEGFKVILKSLMAMGKTYTSAQSIRSYIFKMAKAENEELLAKLEAGEVTVRATREAGRVRQSNPSKSLQAKFDEALNDAVRYGVALKLTPEQFATRAEGVFKQYVIDLAARKEAEKTKQGPVISA
jgi:hypothetical protein